MRDFPSCFGESGVQVSSSSSSSSSSRTHQNAVTYLYRAELRRRACTITVTWTAHLTGHGLSVAVDDVDSSGSGSPLCRLDVKPLLFARRRGSKSLDAAAGGGAGKVEIFWDLSAAKFASGGPEPSEGFYVAVLFDDNVVLLLGDGAKEAYKETNAKGVLVAKKEHLFGKKVYSSRSQLRGGGRVHDVAIECETAGPKEPTLEIWIDKKRVVQVKRLGWKFRGNQTVAVDGASVEVFWDVHGWLFGGHVADAAVFMFRSCRTPPDKPPSLRSLAFSLILGIKEEDTT